MAVTGREVIAWLEAIIDSSGEDDDLAVVADQVARLTGALYPNTYAVAVILMALFRVAHPDRPQGVVRA